MQITLFYYIYIILVYYYSFCKIFNLFYFHLNLVKIRFFVILLFSNVCFLICTCNSGFSKYIVYTFIVFLFI